jgi:hypothetical protein
VREGAPSERQAATSARIATHEQGKNASSSNPRQYLMRSVHTRRSLARRNSQEGKFRVRFGEAYNESESLGGLR